VLFRSDILLTGKSDVSNYVAKIYRNNGDNTFTALTGIIPLTGVSYSSVAWGDYDNDGDLDILLTGCYYDTAYHYVSKIYRNNILTPNNKPNAPSGLSSSIAGGKVTLQWNAAADAQTPQAGLNYNLRIGSASGGVNMISPMANVLTGWRRIPKIGAVRGTSWALDVSRLLPDTQYFWSVQATDPVLAGGSWATEASFWYLPTDTDVDKDGLHNLLENYLGTDPNVSDVHRLNFKTAKVGGNWVFTYRQAYNTQGTSATVQWSTNLQTWQNTGVNIQQGVDLGDAWEMKASLPDTGQNPVFFRLMVEK